MTDQGWNAIGWVGVGLIAAAVAAALLQVSAASPWLFVAGFVGIVTAGLGRSARRKRAHQQAERDAARRLDAGD